MHWAYAKRPYFHFRSKIWRHHRVPRPSRRGNFVDSAINKGHIAHFSLRMRKTAVFPLHRLTVFVNKSRNFTCCCASCCCKRQNRNISHKFILQPLLVLLLLTSPSMADLTFSEEGPLRWRGLCFCLTLFSSFFTLHFLPFPRYIPNHTLTFSLPYFYSSFSPLKKSCGCKAPKYTKSS